MESLAGGLRSAISSSIQADDLFKSDPAEISTVETPTNQSPPFSSTIIDFVPPPRHGPPRIRPAAHLVDDEYLKKYEKAIELMRALPDDDPRSFTQQANLYRAYRDGDYEQIGIPKLDLQVHSSWFFAPWHRFFLYFHERILGKLIGDDNFAIPFWNWDSPEGMARPAFYTEKFSSIHNKNGNPNHQSTVLVDFDGSTNVNFNELEHIEDNLKIMYRHIICNGKTAHNFLGAPYRAGDEPSHGSGALERIPHVRIENSGNSNFEDMGNFYSSGRDKVFYEQHANIDRYWSACNTGGINQGNFDDPEWLNAAFYFYDENKQLVRVKLSDCLDTHNLGYEYQEAEIPWLDKRPTPRMVTGRLLNKNAPVGIGEPVFPITLDKPVSVTVKRPKRGRSRREEVLLVENIVVGEHEFTFDVYINPSEEEKKLRPSASEFAGSFSITQRKHHYGQDRKTNFRLGITDLLEDLGAENDDSVVVTLVPRIGNGNNKATVGGLRIEFSS